MWLEKLSGKRSWQRPIADLISSRHATALFAEQGTGKTYITLGAIEKLMHKTWSGLAIVMLGNIETSWRRRLVKIPGLSVCLNWKEYQEATCPRLLLLAYGEITPRRKKIDPDTGRPFKGKTDTQRLAEKLVKESWSFIVFDESQKLKDRGSKQSRLAARLKADVKLILSGTPMDKAGELDHLNPVELWAQFRFLDPNLFGTVWQDFEYRYCYRTGYGGYTIKFRKRAVIDFLSKIDPYVVRVYEKDVLDLPPLTYHWEPCLLLGLQGSSYRELDKDQVTEVNGIRIMTPLTITEYVRKQQITGGYIVDDSGEIHHLGRAKILRLKSLVKRVDLPAVVFCKELPEVDLVSSAFPNLRVETLTGRVRKSLRPGIQDRFQSGQTDLLVCQVRTGGVGIDLYRSHTAIFYSTTWSFIDFDQAVKRLHRDGQNEPVEIYLLYGHKTIDRLIYETVLLKKDVTERVLNRFKKETS